jgi:hypothetical protein
MGPELDGAKERRTFRFHSIVIGAESRSLICGFLEWIGRAGTLTMYRHGLTHRRVGQCRKLVGCNLVPTWFQRKAAKPAFFRYKRCRFKGFEVC